ncbi:anti-sigma factor [Tropicimonas sp. IMCC6043]|uniref:anti-sigma factor family protein n=1 Tax=Tropicimonas sp. IMCC6043 TaxID=2510645 RepID=UPI00101D3FFE|nr:anti-sigma factor [Tropicimonas sp. IMCC6043]
MQVTVEDIHAYIDGELSDHAAALVRAYLHEHPDAAEVAADYEAINAAILSRSARADALPVPEEHIKAVRGRRRAPLLAASVALIAAGASAGWVAHGMFSPQTNVLDNLARETGANWVTYAPDARRPVELAAADAAQLADWLTNRTGRSVAVPMLDDQGFTFLGGRLVAGETRPAAMLMYQDTTGRRLVVLMSPEFTGDGPTGMHFRRQTESASVIWANGKEGFGVAGPFSEEELRRAAVAVRDGFAL